MQLQPFAFEHHFNDKFQGHEHDIHIRVVNNNKGHHEKKKI